LDPQELEGRLPERTRTAELAALTDIAAQVNCTQDLDEILSSALGTTLDVIGEDSGEIFLVDEETGDLVLRTRKGLSDAFVAEEAVVGAGECLCGRAVQVGKPLVVADLASYPGRTRQACVREGFRSCVRLPLRARGQILGLLNIQSRNHREFSEHEVEWLGAVGNQIGIAIANAQLIEDAERRRATLDSVMSSLVDGLVLINRRNKITYTNPGAEEMLGFSEGSMIGLTLEAVEQEMADRVTGPWGMLTQLLNSATHLEEAPSVEFSLATPVARTLLGRFFHIHEVGGGHLGVGLLLRDITKEKELDRMKSQLLSTVSHELRTPLASIKGFATTLLRQDVEWSDASRREFLSIIDEESDRLTELIGNLLDMSRVEAGELRVEPESIDLGPILEETTEAFQVMTSEYRFLVHHLASLPQVLADPRRTRQVLRNLVENAVKYSPAGGTITLVAQPDKGQVRVSVADQGIGIESKDVDHIFDRFYQVDSASTRRVGGTGLGLAICKAIVEAHRGRIWLESEPGVGSTFYFTLPVAASSQFD
jgi:signal transduction histidine kinase/putative methionine-R-sulfoxide reductase with GAF domain